MGLKVFLITADGEAVENPRRHRQAERYLAKCQRRVAKRKKGGHRRSNAVDILAKAHQHVRRQRSDFHHKTAFALVRQYDTIYVEAIQAANLIRRPEPKLDGNGGYEHNGASRKAGLNKSIQDAGWRQFLSILTFKASSAGKRVEAVSQRTPRRSVPTSCEMGRSAENASPSRSRSVPTYARGAGMWRIETRMRRGTFNGAGSAFGDSWGCLRG